MNSWSYQVHAKSPFMNDLRSFLLKLFIEELGSFSKKKSTIKFYGELIGGTFNLFLFNQVFTSKDKNERIKV